MLFDFPSNWTQIAGLLAFGLASWAAFRASNATRTGSPQRASRWRWIGMVQLAYFVEVLLSVRHMVHDLVNMHLRSVGLYQDRAWIQEALLLGVVLCSFVAAITLWRWLIRDGLRDVPGKTAMLCTAMAMLIFLVETISLHAIDRVLYTPVGPVLLVAYLWGATALGVFLSARWASRATPASS